MTAALVHDLGRTREFTLGAEVGLTDEGRMLGHVEIGARMLEERAVAAGVDEARRLALAHCVLSHHGDRRAATPEALALQRLNALDASVKGGLEHGVTPAGGAG
jgi:3'-5' exoribonuclease